MQTSNVRERKEGVDAAAVAYTFRHLIRSVRPQSSRKTEQGHGAPSCRPLSLPAAPASRQKISSVAAAASQQQQQSGQLAATEFKTQGTSTHPARLSALSAAVCLAAGRDTHRRPPL